MPIYCPPPAKEKLSGFSREAGVRLQVEHAKGVCVAVVCPFHVEVEILN